MSRIGTWIIATLLLLLGGCSALRLGYAQGPVLAYWWLDGYVDFSGEQTPLAKAALADWFAWHRQTQLPEYATWLASLQSMTTEAATPQAMCQITEGAQRRMEMAYAHAVPAMAEILRSFTPAQLDHLAKRYARKNQEVQRDYLQPDPAERAEANLKRTVERAEMLYGALDESQRRLLAAGLAASPFDAQRWLDERRARQQEIVRSLRALLAERAEPAAFQAALRRLAADAVNSPRADYRAYRQRLLDANCALAAQLHNSMKPAQRQHGADKLKGWEEDFRALAND
ncbi:hypothetical protein HLB44_06920 [Aquincola sp. S2]|uniref:Lipoprotein n=1 Tax=Pseudaquabacterium terrae TaxID=2732868 RepID=A0ABX2EC38_9BURK|nr:DUF6279 family lipoprotein [Aquabacterium terrae]NRF66710.1 hypothetical protein [Aquabacterium terrae]